MGVFTVKVTLSKLKSGDVMYPSDAGKQPEEVSYGLLLRNLTFIHQETALTTSTMTVYYFNTLFHTGKDSVFS